MNPSTSAVTSLRWAACCTICGHGSCATLRLFEHAAHANVLGQYAARVRQTPDCHVGLSAVTPVTSNYMHACPCMCTVTVCLILLLLSDICLLAGAESCH